MKRVRVDVVLAAMIATVLPLTAAAGDVQMLEVRPVPADPGERTYFLGANATVEEAVEFRDRLIAAGAWHVNLFLQDRVIVCRMPARAAAALSVPAAFRSESEKFAEQPSRVASESWGWIADAYERVDRAPLGFSTGDDPAAGEPLDDVVLEVPMERVREVQREVEKAMSLRAAAPRPQPARNMNQNSEILTGSILANFIFPESDGSLEGSTETWSDDDMREARIGSAGAFLAWQAWTQMDINTTFNLQERVPTGYEPIKHDMGSDELWIVDVMRELGWGLHTSNSLGAVHEFNEGMRALYRTKWVVTSFIACSRNVPNHRFGNGGADYTAYAYLGGPYMVEPFPAGTDPNGIGETLVYSKIVQHEVGHCFWTLDEYPGAPGGCGDTSGYLNYANGNISMSGPGGEVRCENLTPCIMHTAPRIGQDRPWCRYSLGHLGVIDNNDNGYPDIFEAQPEIVFEPEGPETLSTKDFTLRFTAVSRAVPNHNRAQDPESRVDYAAPLGQVRFALGATSGTLLLPLDGRVDEMVEEFEVPISLATGGEFVVVIRPTNAAGFGSAEYVKRVYFTGINYTRVAAAVKHNRIDVSWETAGETFGAKYSVYRVVRGEPLPGERIAENVSAAGPPSAGFVAYQYSDRDVAPGTDYRYYVTGEFTLPVDGQIKSYSSTSDIVAQTAAIPVPSGELVSGIAPNPSNGNVTLSIQIPRRYGGNPRAPQRLATPVDVSVFDVRGRRIRQLESQPRIEDVLTLRWDGRSEQNVPVPAGIYFVRVTAGESFAVRKIVLLR